MLNNCGLLGLNVAEEEIRRSLMCVGRIQAFQTAWRIDEGNAHCRNGSLARADHNVAAIHGLSVQNC